jgi:hypothetical protein
MDCEYFPHVWPRHGTAEGEIGMIRFAEDTRFRAII